MHTVEWIVIGIPLGISILLFITGSFQNNEGSIPSFIWATIFLYVGIILLILLLSIQGLKSCTNSNEFEEQGIPQCLQKEKIENKWKCSKWNIP